MKNSSEPKKKHDISFITKTEAGDVTTVDIHESDGLFIEVFSSEYSASKAAPDASDIAELLGDDTDGGFLFVEYEPRHTS